MELKGDLVALYPTSFVIYGIHSMELKAKQECFPFARLHYSFESIQWNWKLSLCGAELSYVGEYESIQWNWKYATKLQVALFTRANPFNGIERSGDITGLVRLGLEPWIHSMELKENIAKIKQDVKDMLKIESIQWNWKEALASRSTGASWTGGIHSMELKAYYAYLGTVNPPSTHESIQWNWKTSTRSRLSTPW